MMTHEEMVAFVEQHPKRHRIDPILGLMRQCTVCLEWWCADAEFFVRAPRGGPLGLHSHCKACTSERTARRRAAKVAA